MNIRELKPSDYEIATKWWLAHGWERPISKEVLPPTGITIEGVCMGWVYITNSDVANMCWVVGNPEVKGLKIVQGVVTLMKAMIQLAKKHGNNKVFMSTKHESLIRMAKTAGFTTMEEGATNLLWIEGA